MPADEWHEATPRPDRLRSLLTRGLLAHDRGRELAWRIEIGEGDILVGRYQRTPLILKWPQPGGLVVTRAIAQIDEDFGWCSGPPFRRADVQGMYQLAIHEPPHR